MCPEIPSIHICGQRDSRSSLIVSYAIGWNNPLFILNAKPLEMQSKA